MNIKFRKVNKDNRHCRMKKIRHVFRSSFYAGGICVCINKTFKHSDECETCQGKWTQHATEN